MRVVVRSWYKLVQSVADWNSYTLYPLGKLRKLLIIKVLLEWWGWGGVLI